MEEILNQLGQCSNSEQIQKTLSRIDDFHSPKQTDSAWLFMRKGQHFKLSRHGGYLEFAG